MKNGYPDDKEMERALKLNETFIIRNGEELTQSVLKADVFLLTVVFEKFIEVSNEENDINPMNCVSMPEYTWECSRKYTNINLQTPRDKNFCFSCLKITFEENNHLKRGRVIESQKMEMIFYFEANKLYG